MLHAEDDKAETGAAARVIAVALESVTDGVISLDTLDGGAPAAWLETGDGIVYGVVELARDERGEAYEGGPVYTVLDADGCPVEGVYSIEAVRLASPDEAAEAVSLLVAAARQTK